MKKYRVRNRPTRWSRVPFPMKVVWVILMIAAASFSVGVVLLFGLALFMEVGGSR